MSVSEARRIDLLESAQQHLGRDVAVTLMEMLPPSGSDIATQQGLDALEIRMNARFETVDHRFETVDHRFDAIDHRFDAIDLRFETIDHRFDAMGSRFDAIESRFMAVESRFASVETQMTTTFDSFRAELRGGFADMQRRTIQWSVGTMIAMTTVLTAAVGVFTQLR